MAVDLKIPENSGANPPGWKTLAEETKLREVLEVGEFVHGVLHSAFEDCAALLDRLKPDVILNLGGNSLASEFKDVTRLGAETMSSLNANLVAYSVLRNLRYVYVSSSMVYGNFTSSRGGQSESSQTSPLDPYGALKLGCEKLILAAAHQHPNWDFAIARPSAVYGSMDSNERVIVKFLHMAANGERLTVKDLEEELDFSYVDDVAGMLVRMTDTTGPIRDVFNVSNGKSSSIRDVIEALGRHFPNLQLVEGISDDDIRRPKRGALSKKKFQSRFGEHLSRPVSDGIDALVNESRSAGLI